MFRLRKIAIQKDRDSQVYSGRSLSDEVLCRRRLGSPSPYDIVPLVGITDINIGDEIAITESGRLRPDFLKTSPVEEVFNNDEFSQSILESAYPDFLFARDDHDSHYGMNDEPGNFVRVLKYRRFIRTKTSFYAVEEFTVNDSRGEKCSDKENKLQSNKPITDSSSNAEQADL